jgi:hypothetical protein
VWDHGSEYVYFIPKKGLQSKEVKISVVVNKCIHSSCRSLYDEFFILADFSFWDILSR